MASPKNLDGTVRVSVPLTERKYLAPFVLLTSLFFLWAFGVNLNDILVPHFKAAFGLSDFRSSFIQFAFFGGYTLAAFPAGWLMEQIGYKRGILIGLAVCATGSLLFLPASAVGLYWFFLIALFTLGSGQSFLEVACNPYVTILGPPATSELRLNLAQSFNGVGAFISPIIGSLFILTAVEYTPAQLSVLRPVQIAAYRSAEARTVRMPYLVMAGIFLAVAVLIYFARLPDVVEGHGHHGAGSEAPSASGIFSHKHLVKGVIAQFLYVGAQVGVTSYVIRFAQHTVPSMPAKIAAYYLTGHLIGFTIGRFAGSAMMARISPPKLLSVYAAASLGLASYAVLGRGILTMWALVLIGFFHSIMFPTIFALSIKKLGPHTKRGSSLLVIAISGGAILPMIMGRISDLSNMQIAFVVPLFCYAYILYFAVSGYKPSPALSFGSSQALETPAK
jgi:MFS transporter, FHS family, L-fucose permease